MSKQEQPKQHLDDHKDLDLRGTLVSVSIVALVILVVWLGVWYIFISR